MGSQDPDCLGRRACCVPWAEECDVAASANAKIGMKRRVRIPTGLLDTERSFLVAGFFHGDGSAMSRRVWRAIHVHTVQALQVTGDALVEPISDALAMLRLLQKLLV